MSFRQVLREVGKARDYLDWLVVESSSSSSVDAKADGAEGGAAAEAAPVAGAASDVVVSRYGKEPLTIISVHTNGTIRVQCGSKSERINIRRVTPFSEDLI